MWLLSVLIRSHLRSFAFDSSLFERLCAQLRSGALGSKLAARSDDASAVGLCPDPLGAQSPGVVSPDAADPEAKARWERAGLAALAQGEVAVLIMAGGMATRFGGSAKGSFPLLDQGPTPSFLSLKLAQIAQLCRQHQAVVPVVVMDSFATFDQVGAHLEAIDWMRLPSAQRYRFSQSLMPRLDANTLGTLIEHPDAATWPDRSLYCAPGHGDTLRRLEDSGTLDRLRDRGVRHLLVSNVDNLLASLDPQLVGAHLAGVALGMQVSVEAVPRRPGETGGCVAKMPAGPAIIEAFRLAASTNLDNYPDFNTNTLWISLQSLRTLPELPWHPVTRQIQRPDGTILPCVQFEQLIGEMTEHRDTQVLRVARDQRFLPVKRREDLAPARAKIRELARQWDH